MHHVGAAWASPKAGQFALGILLTLKYIIKPCAGQCTVMQYRPRLSLASTTVC